MDDTYIQCVLIGTHLTGDVMSSCNVGMVVSVVSYLIDEIYTLCMEFSTRNMLYNTHA